MSLAVGVVGAGPAGAMHGARLRGIEGAQLVGVCDRHLGRALELGAQLGVSAFASAAELIESCDALVVAVPAAQHLEVGLQVIRQGRALLMEKPLAATPQEGRQLVDEARRQGVVLQVGHVERFNPSLAHLRQAAQHFDTLHIARVAPFRPRSIDADVVCDLMIHDLDLLQALLPLRAALVGAAGGCFLTRKIDVATAHLQLENGCSVWLHASRLAAQRRRTWLFGEEGRQTSIDLLPSSPPLHTSIDPPGDVTPVDDPLTLQLKAFCSAAATGSEPVVSGEAGLWALEKAHEIVERIHSGARR